MQWNFIGKTYWKSVVQPRILNASSVIVWSREEKKLRMVENRVGGRSWGNWLLYGVGRRRSCGWWRTEYGGISWGNWLLRELFEKMCMESKPKRCG